MPRNKTTINRSPARTRTLTSMRGAHTVWFACHGLWITKGWVNARGAGMECVTVTDSPLTLGRLRGRQGTDQGWQRRSWFRSSSCSARRGTEIASGPRVSPGGRGAPAASPASRARASRPKATPSRAAFPAFPTQHVTQLLDFKPEAEHKGVVLPADLARRGPTLVTGPGRNPPLERPAGGVGMCGGGGQVREGRLTSGTAVSRVERRAVSLHDKSLKKPEKGVLPERTTRRRRRKHARRMAETESSGPTRRRGGSRGHAPNAPTRTATQEFVL